jgi:putative phosphoesterase
MFVYPDRKVKELRPPQTSTGLRSQEEGNPPAHVDRRDHRLLRRSLRAGLPRAASIALLSANGREASRSRSADFGEGAGQTRDLAAEALLDRAEGRSEEWIEGARGPIEGAPLSRTAPSAVRLALIADTHLPRGDRHLTESCIEVLRSADLIVHAGDFSAAAVLAELRRLGPVEAVHGNVDSAELRQELPETLSLELGGTVLGVIHDAGPVKDRLERLRARFPEADAVVFGHSHMPLHEERDGFQIFNPGSPTERRRAPHRSIGEATVRDGRITFRHLPLE